MKKNKKILSAFLSALILISPGMNVRADQTKTVEEIYTSTDAQATFEFSESIEDGDYELENIEYQIVSEDPEMEDVLVVEETTLDVYSRDHKFDQTFDYTVGDSIYPLEIKNTEFKAAKVKLGSGKASITKTEVVEEDPDLLPDAVESEYTDPTSKIKVNVTLQKKSVEEIDGRYEVLTMPMTFYAIDAPYFIFEGEKITNAGDVPSVTGYEQLYLSSLNLNSDYQILSAEWDGEAYMENDILCRHAICYVQRYIHTYEGTYGGDSVTLPEVDGFSATVTYEGTVPQETGNTIYTIKAIATYTETGLSPAMIAVFSIGIVVIILIILIILFSMARKKKKKRGH